MPGSGLTRRAEHLRPPQHVPNYEGCCGDSAEANFITAGARVQSPHIPPGPSPCCLVHLLPLGDCKCLPPMPQPPPGTQVLLAGAGRPGAMPAAAAPDSNSVGAFGTVTELALHTGAAQVLGDARAAAADAPYCDPGSAAGVVLGWSQQQACCCCSTLCAPVHTLFHSIGY